MHPTILLVDDDPTLLLFGEAELSSSGFPVFTAEDGAAAMAVLRAQAIDLVVTDLEMPGMDGLEFVQTLRAADEDSLAEMPVIMLTSRDDDEAIGAAFDAGATSFLNKPINWLSLEHHINFVLRSEQSKRELKRARDDAETAARNRENLMMVMRHELRTPLHLITGYSSFLTGHAKMPEDVSDALGQIDTAASDINRRLSNVFYYSDLCDGLIDMAPKPYDLRDIVAIAKNTVAWKAEEKEVTIATEMAPEIELFADQQASSRALIEILYNAIAASPENGTITVSAEYEGEGTLVVSVADEGPGFEGAISAELLAPFSQRDAGLKRESVGLGLGLAIVNAVMTPHEGTVSLGESGGALVSLRFPVPMAKTLPDTEDAPTAIAV